MDVRRKRREDGVRGDDNPGEDRLRDGSDDDDDDDNDDDKLMSRREGSVDEEEEGVSSSGSEGDLEAETDDEEDEEENRKGDVQRRFEREIVSSANPSVEVLAELVGEHGGEGSVLWCDSNVPVRGTPDSARTCFEICYRYLSEERMAAFLRRLHGEHPGLLSNRCRRDRSDVGTLLHMAVCFPGERTLTSLLRLLVELGPDALTKADESGRLPIHRHVSSDHTVHPPALRVLIDANPATLGMRDDIGRLPLHCALQFLLNNSSTQREGIRILVNESEDALMVRDKWGRTPVMVALDWAKMIFCFFRDDDLDLLLEIIRRGGPRSLWGTRPRPEVGEVALRTALEVACDILRLVGNRRDSRAPELVESLMGEMPIALCLCPTATLMRLPNPIADAVAREARATWVALVEVLLRGGGGSALGPIRERARRAITRLVGVDGTDPRAMARAFEELVRGEAFWRLRSRVHARTAAQELLRQDSLVTEGSLHELVAGLCRMNKAGRLRSDVSGMTPALQARILAAARGELSSIFLHLSDCVAATGRLPFVAAPRV